MRTPTVAVLAALGFAAVAGGWYFGTATLPTERTAVASGGLMFPGLTARLQDAAKVEISHQGKQLVIAKQPDGGWGVASMRGYRVQEAKLRGLLTGLTELRLAEARTSNPAEFSRLGVDDPDAPASTADLLRLLDANDKPILAVIVGHRRVRSQANVPEEVYVRRPGEMQSWLAEGSLQVDADAALWLDRDVLNIGHARVATVAATPLEPSLVDPRLVQAAGGAPPAVAAPVAATDATRTLMFGRVDGKFTLTAPATHPKLEDYKVEDVGRALELLTFQAVKADADAPGSEAGHALFTTDDGLAVRVTVLHADKDVWARFAVSGGDKVRAEADRLNKRLAGWTYQIGGWKEKSLVPSLDDLKAEEPATSGTPGSDTDKK